MFPRVRKLKFIEDEAIDVVNAHTGKAQTMARLLSFVSARPLP